MKILIVEDEQRIARTIKAGLEHETYAVDVSFDGEEGFLAASTGDYDVIVMDVMMPKLDGFEVTRRLRQEEINTPILLLTAKNQPHDVIGGLDSGADDYLAKPFSFDVLLARIRALLRRPNVAISHLLTAEDVILDPASRAVTRSDKPIELTNKEYSILEYLLRNKGRVLSKNNIMTHVWDFDADILPNTIEVFITYLRAKNDKPFNGPAIIKTVRGIGYKIDA